MLGLYSVIGGRGFVGVAYASRTFFGTYRVRRVTEFHVDATALQPND